MMWEIGEIGAGVLLLWFFGDKITDEIQRVAEHSKLSLVAVSAILVSLSTTIPEITTSSIAAVHGSASIASGNAIGSIIANSLLVIGLAALIRPLKAQKEDVPRNMGMITVGGLAFVVLASVIRVSSRLIGGALIVTYMIYLIKTFGKNEKEGEKEIESALQRQVNKKKLIKSSILTIVYGLFVVLGAELFVDGSEKIAIALGVPQYVIGLTLVAIGTSLPELTNTVYSTIKKKSEIGIGNIMGADAMNIFMVLGIAELVRPFHVVMTPLSTVFVFASVMLLYTVVRKYEGVPRWVGIIFVGLYAVYTGLLYV